MAKCSRTTTMHIDVDCEFPAGFKLAVAWRDDDDVVTFSVTGTSGSVTFQLDEDEAQSLGDWLANPSAR